MKNFLFILAVVIPAFIALFAFDFATGAFADKHHLYALYCTVGWVSTAWVIGFLGYRFSKTKKK
jgi:hypothetical protein